MLSKVLPILLVVFVAGDASAHDVQPQQQVQQQVQLVPQSVQLVPHVMQPITVVDQTGQLKVMWRRIPFSPIPHALRHHWGQPIRNIGRASMRWSLYNQNYGPYPPVIWW